MINHKGHGRFHAGSVGIFTPRMPSSKADKSLTAEQITLSETFKCSLGLSKRECASVILVVQASGNQRSGPAPTIMSYKIPED